MVEQKKPTSDVNQTTPQTGGVPTEEQVNRFLEAVESVSAKRVAARARPEPPTDPETYRAVLGYQVISRLVGRRPPSPDDSSTVQVEHAGDALVVNVVAADGKPKPAPEKSKVTMYFESTDPRAPKIVTGLVGPNGQVTLKSDYRDKDIAALAVRFDSRTAVSGRIVPPAKN